jgi:hypothetical protein
VLVDAHQGEGADVGLDALGNGDLDPAEDRDRREDELVALDRRVAQVELGVGRASQASSVRSASSSNVSRLCSAPARSVATACSRSASRLAGARVSGLSGAAATTDQSSKGVKSFLRAPQTGQNQVSGISAKAVPGGMPPSGSPSSGS